MRPPRIRARRPPRGAAALLLAALAALAATAPFSNARAEPERIAWLWDRAALPVQSQAHAAVLVAHVHLSGDDIRTRPRLDTPPLLPATRVTPLVHVEVSSVNPPVDIERARAPIVQAVLRAAATSSSGWVQLDMEARPSQRAFYRSLVHDIHAALPASVRLSVTALAWWCRSGAWLDGLEADEVVPMLFRMGRDAEAMRAVFERSPDKLNPRCRSGALGTSVQEPLAPALAGRYARLYSFDNQRWRNDSGKTTP